MNSQNWLLINKCCPGKWLIVRKLHISVLNGALWDVGRVHFGIRELSQLGQLLWNTYRHSICTLCHRAFSMLEIRFQRPWVQILHSAEKDNMSNFDSNIACLCQSININNNKHIYIVCVCYIFCACVLWRHAFESAVHQMLAIYLSTNRLNVFVTVHDPKIMPFNEYEVINVKLYMSVLQYNPSIFFHIAISASWSPV